MATPGSAAAPSTTATAAPAVADLGQGRALRPVGSHPEAPDRKQHKAGEGLGMAVEAFGVPGKEEHHEIEADDESME